MKCQTIEGSSPNSQDNVPRKNGCHRKSGKNGNGKRILELPEKESLSPENGSEQDVAKLCCEGEELIKILEKDPKNLKAVLEFVQKYKNMLNIWKNSDYCLRLCDLSGTDYMGQDFMQEAWEELYLPKKTKMQVLGKLEYTCDVLPSVPWIVLVGEDGCVYAYGDEELQLIAKSLKEFAENGKKAVYESYSYPESSDEEDQSWQQDEKIVKIRESAREFVNKSSNKFDDFLSFLSS